MSRRHIAPRTWLALFCAGVLVAALAWAAGPSGAGSVPLAALLPQGALMTVESADFGSLVSTWNRSPEQRAWLASASFNAFANSRLFARLQDAQSGFGDAAKTSVDGEFLSEIAGKESIFAWYDIGNLEFLYVSHLPRDRAAKLSLLAQRGSFARREAGGTAFYVRTSTEDSAADASDATQDAADDASSPAEAGAGQPRTVAFAVRNDWLVLATREDLIAGALQLMAEGQGAHGSTASQAAEGWYAAAEAAAPARHGDLHMLLDLQALTKTPQFRTYWIQRNVSDTRQYRAAAVDLYREPGQFREERVLLPLQAGAGNMEQADLGSLEELVPQRAGVYRALAHPGSADALSVLRDKVLVREPAPAASDAVSPEAQTAVTPAGSVGDFESRIDTPQRKTASAGEPFGALQQVLERSGLESMLTVDRTDAPAEGNGFVRIHSAVVLRAASEWNKDALSAAVLASLQERLTTASLGLHWASTTVAGREYLKLSEAYPVSLSIDGPFATISTDPVLMEEILRRRGEAQGSPVQARVLAGFRHDQERADFGRLAANLNVAQTEAGTSAAPAPDPSGPQPVDLFRDNLPSLSTAFQAMLFEHFTETRDAGKVHQTVLYHWAGR